MDENCPDHGEVIFSSDRLEKLTEDVLSVVFIGERTEVLRKCGKHAFCIVVRIVVPRGLDMARILTKVRRHTAKVENCRLGGVPVEPMFTDRIPLQCADQGAHGCVPDGTQKTLRTSLLGPTSHVGSPAEIRDETQQDAVSHGVLLCRIFIVRERDSVDVDREIRILGNHPVDLVSEARHLLEAVLPDVRRR